MKRVFYTHSPITTRLCLGVIEHERTAKADIIWLTARNEKAPDIGRAYCIEDYKSDLPEKGVNFLRCRMGLKKWRCQFERLVDGQNYISYIPQTSQFLFQLITTHPKCSGYYIVEEGTAAYHGTKRKGELAISGVASWKSILSRIYHFLNYGGAFRKNRSVQDFSNVMYRGCFSWNQHAFNGFKNKQLLDCPFIESREYPDIEALVVLDAVVEAGLVQEAWMREALCSVFKLIEKRNIGQVAVKFHPETTRLAGNAFPLWWTEALSDSNASFKITMLSRDFVVEDLAMREGLSVFVNLSSVGLYASLLGREVVSIAKLIAAHSQEYAYCLDRRPKVWKKKINYLSV